MEGDHLAGLCINTIRALRFSTPLLNKNSDIFFSADLPTAAKSGHPGGKFC